MRGSMQRHDALADLSRDHHHGLVAAKRLVEAAGTEDAREEARWFLGFWEDELAAHFTEEEHVLLPVYQRHVDLADDELVLRMLADHAWFRDAVPALADALEAEAPVDEPIERLGERLHDHARFEDRELFGRIEDTLTEDELALVHDRSIAFRREARGEDAIGPRTAREPADEGREP